MTRQEYLNKDNEYLTQRESLFQRDKVLRRRYDINTDAPSLIKIAAELHAIYKQIKNLDTYRNRLIREYNKQPNK